MPYKSLITILRNTLIVGFALCYYNCETQHVKTKNVSGIETLIKQNKDVTVIGQTFNTPLDFSKITASNLVSTGVYQTQIKSSITFKNCVFNQPVIAFRKKENSDVILAVFWGNVSFIDCIFNASVNFRESNIYGLSDFSKSHFKKTTSFEGASFGLNAYFTQCIFDNELRFQNTYFNQQTNFSNTTYLQNASFQNATFNRELQFRNNTFNRYADFSLIDCRADVFFNYSVFLSSADFSNANFNQSFNFIKTTNTKTVFDQSRFMGQIHFSNDSTQDEISFENTFFMLKTENGKP